MLQAQTALLDLAITQFGKDSWELYNIACAAALAGEAFGKLSLPDERVKFRERALEVLKRAIELPNGFSDVPHMLQDVDLADLRDHPQFFALAEQLSRGSHPAVLTSDGTELTRVITATSFEELLTRSRSDQDWRPGSVAVDLVNGTPVAMLLERRPRLTEAAAGTIVGEALGYGHRHFESEFEAAARRHSC
ncbi:MAG UNVERIFIED_CONTAM: hypothetical protein LVR18_12240 [Planctomycetaceae bacterium]